MASHNPNLAPAIIQGAAAATQSATGFLGIKRQYKYNAKLAELQHGKNLELLKYQLDYNTPKSQMARFGEAGLNPNLIYGQGDAGSMQSAPKYPDIQPPDVQGAYRDFANNDIITKLQQLKLMQAQTDLTQNKASESGVKQDLMQAQKDLIRANPYLNEGYMRSFLNDMYYSSTIKESQHMLLNYQAKGFRDSEQGYSVGQAKINKELDLLTQKFNLGEQDKKIKAETINGKNFQNSILEVQKRFMTDAEISPEHIRQFIMMLITKMF